LCQCMQLGSTKTETCWKHACASRRQHVRILQNNQNQLPPQSSVQSYFFFERTVKPLPLFLLDDEKENKAVAQSFEWKLGPKITQMQRVHPLIPYNLVLQLTANNFTLLDAPVNFTEPTWSDDTSNSIDPTSNSATNN
jgi:hypothetical protein